MITIKNRKYETVAQISFDGAIDGLIAYDDKLTENLEVGANTFEFTVDKTSEEVGRIEIGCYVFLNDNNNVSVFEITLIDEDNDKKTLYCDGIGLDLLNEEIEPYKADGSYPITRYLERFLWDSGWEVGINEIPNRMRKLEWEGISNAKKRLQELSGRFDCELDFVAEIDDEKVIKRKINIYERIGNKEPVRLEFGVDVESINREISIQNLATALWAIGENGLTLENYRFNDDRYFLVGKLLVHREASERWSRHHRADFGSVVQIYESTAKTQKELFEATRVQLEKRAYPEVTYTININNTTEKLKKGDTVVIVDNNFTPKLSVTARVLEITRTLSDGNSGTITVTNVTKTIDNIDERLKAFSKLLKENRNDFEQLNQKVLKLQPQDLSNLATKEELTQAIKGTKTYTWLVYADDDTGTGLSLQPLNKKYIGMAFNQSTSEPVLDASLYQYVLLNDRTALEAIELIRQNNENLSNKINETIVTVGRTATKEELNALSTAFSNQTNDYKAMLSRTQVEKFPEFMNAMHLNLADKQKQIETLNKFININDTGITISSKVGGLELRISDSEVAFYDGNKKVVYINNQMLYITAGIFVSSLTIGNHIIEKVYQSNIFTAVRYVGGVTNG